MSFSASLSGLNASQQKLNVIGNNLANINTVGFKASSVQFSDLVSQSVGGSSANPMQVGLGVTTGAISPVFTQGGFDLDHSLGALRTGFDAVRPGLALYGAMPSPHVARQSAEQFCEFSPGPHRPSPQNVQSARQVLGGLFVA